jgi:hypothetical protein
MQSSWVACGQPRRVTTVLVRGSATFCVCQVPHRAAATHTLDRLLISSSTSLPPSCPLAPVAAHNHHHHHHHHHQHTAPRCHPPPWSTPSPTVAPSAPAPTAAPFPAMRNRNQSAARFTQAAVPCPMESPKPSLLTESSMEVSVLYVLFLTYLPCRHSS